MEGFPNDKTVCFIFLIQTIIVASVKMGLYKPRYSASARISKGQG
jgi:hypothetical protein